MNPSPGDTGRAYSGISSRVETVNHLAPVHPAKKENINPKESTVKIFFIESNLIHAFHASENEL